VYALQSWGVDVTDSVPDEAVIAAVHKQLGQLDAAATQAGVALVRDARRAVVVIAHATPSVTVEAFSQVVDVTRGLTIRGRVLFEVDSLRAIINRSEYGVGPCTLDPAIALPAFSMRCELAPGDESAWVQVLALPRGRVLGREVLGLLALRSSDVATHYQPPHGDSPLPVQNPAEFEAAVPKLVNAVRAQIGLAPLQIAPKQSSVASAMSAAFFSSLLSEETAAREVADRITLGLLAGWDVRGGIISGGALTASVVLESSDAKRWLAEALERPVGRAVLLDPKTRVLAVGAAVQQAPSVLAGVALTYAFFEDEVTPGTRAMQVLERLGQVRKARGLGRTLLVRDAPGMQEELARVHNCTETPGRALDSVMHAMVDALGRDVHGFAWEAQDLDGVEFPDALLQKGDLALAAGVTYYRAEGGAWGQYVVLFVVVSIQPGVSV
jgi:hypothetical protein